MKSVLLASSLLVCLLAGCSSGGGGDGDEAEDATDFDDFDAKATDTTGLIRGVIVDDRIVPIKAADVGVSGAGGVQRNLTADNEGRFVLADLQPGTYIVRASTLLHLEASQTVEVVAGVDEPPVTKIQLTRKFTQTAYSESIKQDGFIQCNQAGIYYATAPCVTDYTGIVAGPLAGVGPCTPAGCLPELRTLIPEQRGFNAGVGPGWQSLVFEITWEETSETFSLLGITVSYNATQRPASHNYMSVGSTNPLRAQLDVGVDHENSNDVEPDLLDPAGRPDLYYFVGVRADGFVPAVAVNQKFQLFANFFYYGAPPAGWSFVKGDALPF